MATIDDLRAAQIAELFKGDKDRTYVHTVIERVIKPGESDSDFRKRSSLAVIALEHQGWKHVYATSDQGYLATWLRKEED